MKYTDEQLKEMINQYGKRLLGQTDITVGPVEKRDIILNVGYNRNCIPYTGHDITDNVLSSSRAYAKQDIMLINNEVKYDEAGVKIIDGLMERNYKERCEILGMTVQTVIARLANFSSFLANQITTELKTQGIII